MAGGAEEEAAEETVEVSVKEAVKEAAEETVEVVLVAGRALDVEAVGGSSSILAVKEAVKEAAGGSSSTLAVKEAVKEAAGGSSSNLAAGIKLNTRNTLNSSRPWVFELEYFYNLGIRARILS
jgi:hypothetical protein